MRSTLYDSNEITVIRNELKVDERSSEIIDELDEFGSFKTRPVFKRRTIEESESDYTESSSDAGSEMKETKELIIYGSNPVLPTISSNPSLYSVSSPNINVFDNKDNNFTNNGNIVQKSKNQSVKRPVILLRKASKVGGNQNKYDIEKNGSLQGVEKQNTIILNDSFGQSTSTANGDSNKGKIYVIFDENKLKSIPEEQNESNTDEIVQNNQSSNHEPTNLDDDDVKDEHIGTKIGISDTEPESSDTLLENDGFFGNGNEKSMMVSKNDEVKPILSASTPEIVPKPRILNIVHVNDNDAVRMKLEPEITYSTASTPTLIIDEPLDNNSNKSLRVISVRRHLGLNSQTGASRTSANKRHSVSIEPSDDQVGRFRSKTLPSSTHEKRTEQANRAPNIILRPTIDFNLDGSRKNGLLKIHSKSQPTVFSYSNPMTKRRQTQVSFDLNQNKCYEYSRADVSLQPKKLISGYVSSNGDAPGEGINKRRPPYHRMIRNEYGPSRLPPLTMAEMQILTSDPYQVPLIERPRLRRDQTGGLRRPVSWRNSMDLESIHNELQLTRRGNLYQKHTNHMNSLPSLSTIAKPPLPPITNGINGRRLIVRPRLANRELYQSNNKQTY